MEILDAQIRSPPEKKRKVDDESDEDRVNGSSESKDSMITTESFESRGSAMSKGSSGSEESALLSAGDEHKDSAHHRIPPFVKEKVGFKVCYGGEGEESSDEDMAYFSGDAYRREIKETDHGDEQKVLPHHRIPPFVKEKVGFKVYYGREGKESSDEDIGYFSDNEYWQEIKETDNGDEQKGDEQKVLPHHRIPPFVKEKVGFKVYYGREGKESSDEDMG